MSDRELAARLVAAVPANLPGLFNPWLDNGPDDTALNDAKARIDRLAPHLARAPEFICVGEGAGWLGMKRAAIAFTSERRCSKVPFPALQLWRAA